MRAVLLSLLLVGTAAAALNGKSLVSPRAAPNHGRKMSSKETLQQFARHHEQVISSLQQSLSLIQTEESAEIHQMMEADKVELHRMASAIPGFLQTPERHPESVHMAMGHIADSQEKYHAHQKWVHENHKEELGAFMELASHAAKLEKAQASGVSDKDFQAMKDKLKELELRLHRMEKNSAKEMPPAQKKSFATAILLAINEGYRLFRCTVKKITEFLKWVGNHIFFGVDFGIGLEGGASASFSVSWGQPLFKDKKAEGKQPPKDSLDSIFGTGCDKDKDPEIPTDKEMDPTVAKGMPKPADLKKEEKKDASIASKAYKDIMAIGDSFNFWKSCPGAGVRFVFSLGATILPPFAKIGIGFGMSSGFMTCFLKALVPGMKMEDSHSDSLKKMLIWRKKFTNAKCGAGSGLVAAAVSVVCGFKPLIDMLIKIFTNVVAKALDERCFETIGFGVALAPIPFAGMGVEFSPHKCGASAIEALSGFTSDLFGDGPDRKSGDIESAKEADTRRTKYMGGDEGLSKKIMQSSCGKTAAGTLMTFGWGLSLSAGIIVGPLTGLAECVYEMFSLFVGGIAKGVMMVGRIMGKMWNGFKDFAISVGDGVAKIGSAVAGTIQEGASKMVNWMMSPFSFKQGGLRARMPSHVLEYDAYGMKINHEL